MPEIEIVPVPTGRTEREREESGGGVVVKGVVTGCPTLARLAGWWKLVSLLAAASQE